MFDKVRVTQETGPSDSFLDRKQVSVFKVRMRRDNKPDLDIERVFAVCKTFIIKQRTPEEARPIIEQSKRRTMGQGDTLPKVCRLPDRLDNR